MKQFAFALAALLSTSALAQEEEKPFVVSLGYASSADFDLSLDLELDNPVTFKLPCARSREIECTGWELAAPDTVYADFTVTRMEREVGRRGKVISYYEFLADGATLADGESVTFANTCAGMDAEGNYLETIDVHVVANSADI